MHAQSGVVVGLLREWIPSSTRGRTLANVGVSTVPQATRQRWAAQIRKTLDQLHAIGVIWGDGKPGNVIIDQDDQAWLIDLAGGWTEGWVEPDLTGTVEGDHQALSNIVKFLSL